MLIFILGQICFITWFIQTKADGIQGFSKYFKAKFRHFQGPYNEHELGSHDKNFDNY